MIKKYLEYITENQDSPESYEEIDKIPIKITYDELTKVINQQFKVPEQPYNNPYGTRQIELEYNKGKVIDLEYGEVDIEIFINIDYNFINNGGEGYYDTISYSDIDITTYIGGNDDFSKTDYFIIYMVEGLVTDKTNMEKHLLKYIQGENPEEWEKIRTNDY